jgi:cyclic dehypoxanthinyl futalosine synthase
MDGGTDDAYHPNIGCAHRLFDEIGETVELGSTCVRLVSGVGGPGSQWKDCGMAWFEGMLRGVRQRFPSLWIEALSAAEIVALAAGSGLDLRQMIARLRDAGLDSIAGDEAASLGAAVSLGNRVAQPQCSLDKWLAVHRAAHGLGMSTVATMNFGAGKAHEQRVAFLDAVRLLQEETGGFTAFIPRSLPSRNAAGLWDGPTAVEQLKTLAVARVFLDNIQNIQLSGAAQELKVLQMGLRFGANDAGSIAPSAHGAKPVGGAISGKGLISDNGANVGGGKNEAAANHPSEEDLRRIIRDAGFQPVQRDLAYRAMYLN